MEDWNVLHYQIIKIYCIPHKNRSKSVTPQLFGFGNQQPTQLDSVRNRVVDGSGWLKLEEGDEVGCHMTAKMRIN